MCYSNEAWLTNPPMVLLSNGKTCITEGNTAWAQVHLQVPEHLNAECTTIISSMFGVPQQTSCNGVGTLICCRRFGVCYCAENAAFPHVSYYTLTPALTAWWSAGIVVCRRLVSLCEQHSASNPGTVKVPLKDHVC